MRGITDLCNRALSILGDDRIETLEDNTVASEACKHSIPDAIRYVGVSSNWYSMRDLVILNKLAQTSPLKAFKFVYAIPPNVLKIIELAEAGNDNTQNTFRIINNKFYTNLEEVVVEAIVYTEHVGNWTPPLYEYMATYLAFLIARAVNTDEQIVAQLPQQLETARNTAMYHEEVEASKLESNLYPTRLDNARDYPDYRHA